MKDWLKKLEDTMAAAAYAEEGEFGEAQQLIKEKRKILLALTGKNSDINAFRYATSMCMRISAVLEIMFARETSKDFLRPFTTKLENEGLEYRLIPVIDCVKEEVLNYTSERTDILFVILESSDGLDLKCKKTEKIISGSWKNLKCPLVVVSDLATA